MKFNDIVKQFQHNVFGNLTTIRSFKYHNKIWFLGSEIQDLLEFINLTQVIKNAKLNSNEKFVLTKKNHPKFWDDFVTTYHVGAKVRNITFISESGLYKLILRSNKVEALKFSDWVTREVLPNLRQGVENSLVMKKSNVEISKHMDIVHQKVESNNVNGVNMKKGGVNNIINYNRKSCLDHSGRTPSQLKKWARDNGVPSSKRTSGKEVLRLVDMPTASSMSLTDNLVSNGVEYIEALKVSNGTGKELFKQLLELGIEPKELRQ